MSKEELLKYLIAEIDLIMHDKQYRFKNEDGTWYSRESCKDLTNEEVFEELKKELKQLNNQIEIIADLEAKLAEAQKTIEIQRMSNDALIDENLDYRYDITDSAYEQAKYMVESWEEDYQQEIAELKQELEEKDKAIENWQTMYQSVMQSCHNGIEEDKRLREQFAEKEQELEEVKKSKTYIMNFGDKVKEVQVIDDNQDKISFAIEQLEKVKANVNKTDKNGYLIKFANLDERLKFYKEIDNQIKELK